MTHEGEGLITSSRGALDNDVLRGRNNGLSQPDGQGVEQGHREWVQRRVE